MKWVVTIICAAVSVGCEGKRPEVTSCETVAERLVKLKAGEMASFMTARERTSRAQRLIAKCEPMTETTRKCVLAAVTMAQADACSGAAAEGTGARAAWVVRGGDAADQEALLVALAANDDVVAAGVLDGTLELSRQIVTAERTDVWVARLSPTGAVLWAKGVGGKGRDYVKGLRIAADGSVVIAVRADEAPRFSRVTLAIDGTATPTPIETEHTVSAAALHANGDVVVGSRVIEPVKGGTCAAMGFAVQRFAANGKRLWSRCNDGEPAVTLTDDPMQLAAGPDGMTAVCGGFSGALAWNGKVAPDHGSSERAFVMALDANGQPSWVGYVAGQRGVICDMLTVTDDGNVVAVILGTAPGSALALWETNGTQRWTRSCSELLGAGEECQISAVTASGPDVIVAAQSGTRTVIAAIDGRTGEKTRVSRFDEGTRIDGLAARARAVVFATGFSGTVNFGAGAVESTAGSDGASMDVLVGRL